MKETKMIQKQLKEAYMTELQKVWPNSERMVNYCLGTAKYLFQIRNFIIPFEKLYIEKDFWFGYSDCGQGLSYDENNDRINHCSENIIKYFLNRNLSSITDRIKKIEEILETYEKDKYFSRKFAIKHNYDESNIGEIIYREYYDDYSFNKIEDHEWLTIGELRTYLSHLLIWKEMCEKKLQTYLRKYGTKHISFNTYWVDR